MTHSAGIVIVGAGLAGARAAVSLREQGYAGPVTLLGAEPHPPYDRPPLSKAFLLRQKTARECALFDCSFFADRAIRLQLAAEVTAIDRRHRHVLCATGEQIEYERLLLTMGAEPRLISGAGAHLSGIAYLRTLDDAERLAAALLPGHRLVVIGGGFIGLEVAASAIAAGCSVTVIESGPRLLMRAIPEPIAQRVEALHRHAGVRFCFGGQIAGFEGEMAVRAVRLADGEQILCDSVIVGIGARPRTELAVAAGLEVTDGILVDAQLVTSDPVVYAAGDVCSFTHPLYRRRIRLECWKNADDQARVAAANMMGGTEIYREVPWFWSDQYDTSIQVAGLPGAGATVVQRSLPDALILFHVSAAGILVAASGIGRGALGRDIRVAQMLIARSARIPAEMLSDPALKLKSLLATELA